MSSADPPSDRSILGRLTFVLLLVAGFVGYAIGQGLPGAGGGPTVLGVVAVNPTGVLVAIASMVVAGAILGGIFGAVTFAASRSDSTGSDND